MSLTHLKFCFDVKTPHQQVTLKRLASSITATRKSLRNSLSYLKLVGNFTSIYLQRKSLARLKFQDAFRAIKNFYREIVCKREILTPVRGTNF